jgi:hypothetical protein
MDNMICETGGYGCFSDYVEEMNKDYRRYYYLYVRIRGVHYEYNVYFDGDVYDLNGTEICAIDGIQCLESKLY